jgi:hypothetical protein
VVDFLVTEGVSHHLQQMIANTKERLILISPYLKINERIRQSLEELDRFKINVRLVFRDYKLSTDEQMWLEGLLNIHTSNYEHLHAKCYLNENEAIVTSMNLYETSQVHNYEMGIHVSRQEDPELYEKINREAMRLVRIAKEIRISVLEVPKTAHDERPPHASANSGHCISCGTTITLDPETPYCRACYGKWKRKADKNQVERFCHVCGQPHESTLNKPACYKCFKAHKILFPEKASK